MGAGAKRIPSYYSDLMKTVARIAFTGYRKMLMALTDVLTSQAVRASKRKNDSDRNTEMTYVYV